MLSLCVGLFEVQALLLTLIAVAIAIRCNSHDNKISTQKGEKTKLVDTSEGTKWSVTSLKR